MTDHTCQIFLSEIRETRFLQNGPSGRLRRSLETCPLAYSRNGAGWLSFIANQDLDLEEDVWNFDEVSFEHFAITRQPDPPTIVCHFVVNEHSKFRPILPIEASDVIPIDDGLDRCAQKNCSSLEILDNSLLLFLSPSEVVGADIVTRGPAPVGSRPQLAPTSCSTRISCRCAGFHQPNMLWFSA
jgi:hypothetical protein